MKTSLGKLFTLVLALIFCHIKASAKSNNTTYDIQSLEGKKQKVLIMDTYSETIVVIHKNDTLTLYGNKHGIQDVKLLNPYFLQITYAMHGGSEVKRRAIAVVCIYNNKLHIPLPLFITSESFVHGMFFDFSRVSLKIEPDLKDKFKLTVTEHAFVRDLDTFSKILCDEKVITVVKFDTAAKLFCNKKEKLNKTYKLSTERSQDAEETIMVNGEIPLLKLNNPKCKECGGGTWYLYYNKNWLEESGDNDKESNLNSLTY